MSKMDEILEELDRTDALLKESLGEINSKGTLDKPTLEILGEVLDAIKDSCIIHEKTEKYDGHSYGAWDARGSYDGYSGRRDSRGRYARDSYSRDTYGNSYDGNSYGMSRGEDPFIEGLKKQMQQAQTEQEREVIHKMIMERERSR